MSTKSTIKSAFESMLFVWGDPLEAKTAAEIFSLAEAAVKSGNKNAVTDGLVAAMMARTAVLGALLNVKINLGSIRDEAFVSELREECSALQAEALAAEQRILDLAPELK